MATAEGLGFGTSFLGWPRGGFAPWPTWAIMVLRASHGGLGVDEHLIEDGLWQRVPAGLRSEP